MNVTMEGRGRWRSDEDGGRRETWDGRQLEEEEEDSCGREAEERGERRRRDVKAGRKGNEGGVEGGEGCEGENEGK